MATASSPSRTFDRLFGSSSTGQLPDAAFPPPRRASPRSSPRGSPERGQGSPGDEKVLGSRKGRAAPPNYCSPNRGVAACISPSNNVAPTLLAQGAGLTSTQKHAFVPTSPKASFEIDQHPGSIRTFKQASTSPFSPRGGESKDAKSEVFIGSRIPGAPTWSGAECGRKRISKEQQSNHDHWHQKDETQGDQQQAHERLFCSPGRGGASFGNIRGMSQRQHFDVPTTIQFGDEGQQTAPAKLRSPRPSSPCWAPDASAPSATASPGLNGRRSSGILPTCGGMDAPETASPVTNNSAEYRPAAPNANAARRHSARVSLTAADAPASRVSMQSSPRSSPSQRWRF